jgi:hypothetical protein
MCNDDTQKEVPMTADPVGEILERTRARDWPWADLQELAGGGIYREVATVRAGESVPVDVPFPVELRPAELAGPRRRG